LPLAPTTRHGSPPSGTAGIEWTPDSDSLYYFKYGRGYKSGGYNIGIFTILSFEPYTNSEHVNSFEVGAKHTFGNFLTAKRRAVLLRLLGLADPDLNRPGRRRSVPVGDSFLQCAEVGLGRFRVGDHLDANRAPRDPVQLFVSRLSHHARDGRRPSRPERGRAEREAALHGSAVRRGAALATPPCLVDVYSLGTSLALDKNAGWNIPQNLTGNPLPNAPKNKVAVNVLYTIKTGDGSKWEPSVSYVWRDQEYGLFFKEAYDAAPAWDEWDARLSFTSASGKLTVIGFIKNIANNIGYDQGALGTRAAGVVDIPGGAAGLHAGQLRPRPQRAGGLQQPPRRQRQVRRLQHLLRDAAADLRRRIALQVLLAERSIQGRGFQPAPRSAEDRVREIRAVGRCAGKNWRGGDGRLGAPAA